MPFFLGCRCCDRYVTTRKLTTALDVVWNGDFGPMVQPGPLENLYPNSDGNLVRLTDIDVDPQGRVWCTATAFLEHFDDWKIHPTAKEFAAADGDLTARSFDWNTDNQGGFARGNLHAVAVNSLGDLYFGGSAIGFKNTHISAILVNQDLLFASPLHRHNADVSEITTEIECDRSNDYFYGYDQAAESLWGLEQYPPAALPSAWSQPFVFPDPSLAAGGIVDIYAYQTGIGLFGVGVTFDFSTGNARLHLTGTGSDGNGHSQTVLSALLTPTSITVVSTGKAIGLNRITITATFSLVLFDASNDRIWSFDTGSDVLDVATDQDGNIVAVGERVENFAPKLYDENEDLVTEYDSVEAATMWKLSPDGELLATFDHKETLRAVTTREEFVYVCGDRADTSV